MKILFVAPRFHTNQVQLIKKLQEKKHEVFFHVACIGPTEDHSLITPLQFKKSKLSGLIEMVFGKGGVNRKFYFPQLASYWRAFKQMKPDFIVIRDPYKLFSLMAAFYARLIKTKIIFYTQEDLFRYRSKRTLLKQKLTIRFFKAAWMTPVKGSDAPESSGELKYMYYVPLPVIVSSAEVRSNDISSEGPRILMVGKYHQARKKHLLFLQALGKLKSRYRFTVTIAGECATAEQELNLKVIRHEANSLQLAGLVNFKQNVPYSQMAELYASHHIFVLPAINEQYGVSVNEALGYALPVICTDTCGAKFNITNGNNGFVVKSNSLDELIAALERLISDYQKLHQMRQQSLQYARENLSADVFYSKFARLTQERFSVLMN
ncbi:glycosyltransferase family 4 protein [Niastella caeni]|uniref:Glycosyltransferase family 4 protein n=1 Tax=Niastella caeni TaxID=2569763 RepID=A0A4S8HUS4_9BACT|nr:glycosyltransferase family 4 protein [Niastella caeni]THU39363.1 glycosyltransferase family 4 protein [Niastella caeni]